MKNNIFDKSYSQLEEELVVNGIPKFRTKQIWNFLYVKLVENFKDMKNLDSKTIEYLEVNYEIPKIETIKHLKDNEGTQKVLLRLRDSQTVETVIMRHNHGLSVCVTTQIGCKIGCSFCASHLGGFKRNLSSGEIVEQVVFWQKVAREMNSRVSHIVVMGIGEPMDNLDNILTFFDVVNDSRGLNVGARHITLSTSGIVPKIYEFAEYPKQINLAISLHAPNDKIRSSIMKINDVYNINDIMKSVDFYINKTNRRVSFEYIMLKDVNDSIECAYELAKLLKGINCHVNLIPFNSVEEYELSKSSKETTERFEEILKERKIQVTTRHSKGQDIDGACGQLRRKNEN